MELSLTSTLRVKGEPERWRGLGEQGVWRGKGRGKRRDFLPAGAWRASGRDKGVARAELTGSGGGVPGSDAPCCAGGDFC